MEKVYKKVLKKLIDNGYEAYFVGGYVRDKLLGIYTDDIDITTNAKSNEIISLFDKVIPTGIDHGTVTVILEGQQFEITTYRTDGDYSDFRHPEKVEFVNSLVEDLKRRDFTINAIAIDYNDNIIDLLDGQQDLNEEIIRSIGKADKRFNEDALRMLRAIRFQSKLGFKIEEETFNSIKRNQALLSEVSIERIRSELEKTFLGDYYHLAIKSLEEVNFDILKDFKGLYYTEELSVIERYALCYYLSPFDLNKWKFSKQDSKQIVKIKEGIDYLDRINSFTVYKFGLDLLYSNKINKVITNNDYTNKIRLIYNTLPIKSRKDLMINGNDILDLGFNGPAIGDIINDIEAKVVKEELLNNKQDIIKYIRRSYND